MSIFIKKQRDAQKAKSRYLLTKKSSLIWVKLHQANLFSKEMGLKIVIPIGYQGVKKISLTAMPPRGRWRPCFAEAATRRQGSDRGVSISEIN